MNEENTPQIEAAVAAETERRKNLLKPGILPGMTILDAVKIVRAEAAKNTGDLRSALTMLADLVHVTPPEAIDAVLSNPKMETVKAPPFGGSVAVEHQASPLLARIGGRRRRQEKSNLVGMSCGQNSILAWNFAEGLHVRIAAERKGDNYWQLTASHGDNTRMIASIFGGRWTANTYVRLMRNALTAREKKIRRSHENRKAKKAAIAAANAEQEGAGK